MTLEMKLGSRELLCIYKVLGLKPSMEKHSRGERARVVAGMWKREGGERERMHEKTMFPIIDDH